MNAFEVSEFLKEQGLLPNLANELSFCILKLSEVQGIHPPNRNLPNVRISYRTWENKDIEISD